MTAPTTPAGDKPLPTGWRGPVLPLNTPSGDMRQFMLADGVEPAIRPLPVALSAQDEMWDNHEGSRVVGLVTRAWVQDGYLWAEGPLDLDDEFGAAYARKLGDGFAGWVSADLSDISLEEIPLRSDKSEWAPDELAAAYAAFDEGTGDEPDVAGQLLRVHEWKLMGVTGVSSPAFETSRIEPVYGDEFTAVRASAALTAAAQQHSGAMIALVPSAEDCARLAIDGYEPADVLHTTLVFLGDAANWLPEQRDALEQAVRVLDFTCPLSGSVMGHAQFNPAGDEPCAVYLVEARGLSATQSCTYGAVADNVDLPPIPEPYDTFLPHITAGYGLDVSKLTEVGPIRFDRIRLSFADTDVRDIPLEPVTAGLVASSVVYDTADFTMPEPDELTALTVTDDGRVYGHLAQADSCHIGFADVCVSPPTSATGYAYFHQGEISTTEGPLPVGKLTLGTGHAGMRQAARAAAAHYDNTGTAVAVVRCADGLWGPWLSGRILPGVDDDRIDELRRSGVSGDWRSIQRGSNNLELVAVLAVNVPGFPVPRTRALAASGMRSLIAAGIPPTRKRHDPPTATKKTIDIAQVRATALRKSRSQTAAQRVRTARLAAATRRVERLGKERRVRTPGGAKKFGQPIDSVIKGKGRRAPRIPEGGGAPAGEGAETRTPDPSTFPAPTDVFTMSDSDAEVALSSMNGQYGDLHLRMGTVSVTPPNPDEGEHGAYIMGGTIYNFDGDDVGSFERRVNRDVHGNISVEHTELIIDEDHRGTGFSTEFGATMNAYYEQAGIQSVSLHATLEDGGNAWARAGYTWDTRNQDHLEGSIANVRGRLDEVRATASPADQVLIDDITERMDQFGPGTEAFPSPREIARLSGDDPELGRTVMRGSDWYGIRELHEPAHRSVEDNPSPAELFDVDSHLRDGLIGFEGTHSGVDVTVDDTSHVDDDTFTFELGVTSADGDYTTVPVQVERGADGTITITPDFDSVAFEDNSFETEIRDALNRWAGQ